MNPSLQRKHASQLNPTLRSELREDARQKSSNRFQILEEANSSDVAFESADHVWPVLSASLANVRSSPCRIKRPAKVQTPTNREQHAKRTIAVLTKSKRGEVNVCEGGPKNPTWRKLALTIDSGACDSVMSPDELPDYEVIETAESKRGECFHSATSEEIPNLGMINVPMLTNEGTARGMRITAAPVSKPLAAVKKICKAGHSVVFDEECPFIFNKETGEINWLRDDDDGNYVLDVWVPPRGVDPAMGFGRQP